jgi:hypothetical protein
MGDYKIYDRLEETKILSVHKLRRNARREERRLTNVINFKLPNDDLPYWAKGVRVEKAGPFQHAVVATSRRGH